ncbi:carbon starvation CstA family protein [Phorcysia thermohydrogeniphila]|uniref:Carbon starvation protein n=1 Tax=Phorcysia thermohydrogeniphila TaxID=936138 RepID=A0A4R1GDJ9_9BACT|nr:carbon starvation protein A [Phorcysia thermohydrogeniphila]TCK06407.1 carbon starvation protein [Phorcysia thermohydrogeniphila]
MLTVLFIVAILLFGLAFFTYGRFLRDKVFNLNDKNKTPAHTMKDGVDYVPAPAPVLLGHHFSSIAGAGPILGPINAATSWGWLPAYLWIIIGNIFFGGVHDMSALIASIRNKARSIAEIGSTYLSKRAGFIFKLLIWLALLYVIAVFINVAQMTFNAKMPVVENGQIVKEIPIGGGVATSAIIYIVLAIIFGFLVYHFKKSLKLATLIFVILVYGAVYVGQLFPINLSANAWNIILLLYVAIASVTPVWILLQPRDYLSSFLLYGAVIGAGIGILLSFGKVESNLPAFIGFFSSHNEPLIPLLFVVIACGSISGFHSLVGSGTTSKQLDKESDALTVGYGAMLLEGVVAVMSVIFVMALTTTELEALRKSSNIGAIYGAGIGRFMNFLGIPETVGMAFGMLALSSFILTSTDTGTRLARYVFTELTGIKNRFIATGASLIIPALLVFLKYKEPLPNGEVKVLPVWKALWPVFGATNQLIAALALFVVMIWLIKTGKGRYWFIPGVPAFFMAVITLWSLVMLFIKWKFSVIGIAALIQVVLATWIFYEGALALKKLQEERHGS